jgi:CRISPR system Cascade subunit CasA
MSRFNLIDEPWIPVRLGSGENTRLGLREVLTASETIAAIEDPSPLVVAALHRLLLAVLYRALAGPTDTDMAKALFRNGIPQASIRGYLDKWRDRFWLFHPTHPFGQIPGFVPREWKPWTVLAAEHNADNAKVLFDHVDINRPGVMDEAAIVCWLLATQTFSVGCGNSELGYTSAGPSPTAVMVLPLGTCLHDTLLFSLVPQPREILAQDLPIWERAPEDLEVIKQGRPRAPAGLADRLTWRTRSVHLLEREEGAGISHLGFAAGIRCEPTEQVDPMLGYRIDPKHGKLPIQFQDRGLWRDFEAMLPDGGSNAPKSVEHAVTLTRRTPDRFPRTLLALGLCKVAGQAKIEFWRMERFGLPGALAGDQDVRSLIRTALDKAEDAGQALRKACSTYARNLLTRGDRTVKTQDVDAFLDQMLPIPLFWSGLERRFHQLLDDFTQERLADDLARDWLVSCRAILREAWGRHLETVFASGDAWAIRAAVKAERSLLKETRLLEAEISHDKLPEAP